MTCVNKNKKAELPWLVNFYHKSNDFRPHLFQRNYKRLCTTVVNKNTQEQQDSAQEFCQTLFDSAKLQNEFSTKT